MIKYFLFPILFLLVGILTLYFSLDFYKMKIKANNVIYLNYTYILIAIIWMSLSIYIFIDIVQQFIE